MFKKLSPALVVAQVVAVLLMFASPAFAATETSHSYSNQAIVGNVDITGNLSVSGTTTQTGAATFGNTSLKVKDTGGDHATTIKQNSNEAANRTANIPALGADADFVMTVGAQTIAGVKTFSSPPTITGGLTAANIQSGSAKREVFVAYLSPNTGAAADSTVYRQTIFPGRAGTVTKISYGAQTAPTVGTDTIKVLKGSSPGNTMLSTATVDANGITANQVSTATLTGTTADLGIAASGAGSCIYCEYSQGTATVDAIGVTVTIEFEPTDF